MWVKGIRDILVRAPQAIVRSCRHKVPAQALGVVKGVGDSRAIIRGTGAFHLKTPTTLLTPDF